MPQVSEDLHGNAPDKASVALLVIDLISDFEFQDGEQLMQYAEPAAQNTARLKARAQQEQIPVIYINDNFGKWRSDFSQQVKHCLEEPVRGQKIARLLKPEKDDYSVLKPKHSAFYKTPLDLLLEHLEVRTLILTGVAGDVCVLFTANDAFLREFRVIVPSDCIASLTPEDNRRALEQMQKTLKADIRPQAELDLGQMTRESEKLSR